MRPYFYTWSDLGLHSCKFTYVCILVNMRTFTEMQFIAQNLHTYASLYIYICEFAHVRR